MPMQRMRKLGRTALHRRDLLRTLLGQLVVHEQIITTNAKAREVQKVAEKAIALAKRDTDYARWALRYKVYQQETVVPKLLGELRFRYRDRKKNFARVTLAGYRQRDQGERALIELVDSPTDTHSLFALEFLPKVRRELELVRLRLLASQQKKEPDWYARYLKKKEEAKLSTRERFLERLVTRLEHALEDKRKADQTRVDWAEWEISREVAARKEAMDDIKAKLEAYARLDASISDDDLRSIIERGKYDLAWKARISWDDWTTYLATGEVQAGDNKRALLEEMLARQQKGLELIEAVKARAVGPTAAKPAPASPKAKKEVEEDSGNAEKAEPKKKSGGLFQRLMGRFGVQ
ncbi:ribosomal protein L17 [Hyaloraphidium curvatum]|nr:ribosomal protein L17 [Hyaloraphidium curvatum]